MCFPGGLCKASTWRRRSVNVLRFRLLLPRAGVALVGSARILDVLRLRRRRRVLNGLALLALGMQLRFEISDGPRRLGVVRLERLYLLVGAVETRPEGLGLLLRRVQVRAELRRGLRRSVVRVGAIPGGGRMIALRFQRTN